MPRILSAAATTAVLALVGALLGTSPAIAADGDGLGAASISGTVRGAVGEPFEGACVTVSSDDDGDGNWTLVGEPVQTVADGGYAIAGLPAGTYAVSADGCGDVSFEATWYRTGTTRPASADEGLIALAEDASATDVDIQLIAAPIQNLEAPGVAGVPVVGQELTATPGTWSPDGLDFAYQWNADDAPIDGATAPTFVVTADQLGASISVAVTATRPGFETAAAVSAPTGHVVAGSLPAFTAEIAGDAQVGAPLSTVLPDGDGVAAQWNRGDTPIEGATGATYVPTVDDLGATITVTITRTVDGYETRSVTSSPTGAVVEGVLPEFVPVVSGAAAVGATLSSSVPSSGAVTVQWLRNGEPIAGEMSPSYVVKASDLGSVFSVEVTQSVPGYAVSVTTSVPTAAVALGTQPVFTPVVSGTVAVGRTLAVSVPAGPAYTYQWYRNGAAISGATSSKYVVVAADLGLPLKVRVVAKVTGYADRTAYSASTVKVVAGTIASFTPVVKGTTIVGSTLGVTVPSGNSYKYQWLRNGARISGATASTYKLVTADAGTKVSVTVVASRTGYTSLSKTSAATPTVLRALTASPTPTISGTRKVGYLLTAVPGTWSPAPVALKYQWYRSGTAITGATASTYRAAAADLGKSVTVVVTGSKSGYATVARKSAGTAAIVPGTISLSTPSLSGQVRVGYTLTASATASPTATLKYQWYLNSTAISGATAKTFAVKTWMIGKQVSVKVTASRSGYSTVSKFSTRTVGVLTAYPSITANGVYKVGVDIKPGTYYTKGGVDQFCYWELTTDYAGSDIIQNDWSDGRRMVTILSSDPYFYTQDCGAWYRYDGTGSRATSFDDGVYGVGANIQAGLYQSLDNDPDGYCYVAGLALARPYDTDAINWNDIGYGGDFTVRIDSTDKYFESDGCNKWVRISG